MAKIIPTNILLDDYRKNATFISRNTRIVLEDGTIDYWPCILLIDSSTLIPIAYTGYERYIINFFQKVKSNGTVLKGTTLSKRASDVCSFLNYILHNTDINSLNECTLADIRNYLLSIKTDKNNNPSKENTWDVKKYTVLSFLSLYFSYNKELLDFLYDGNSLVEKVYLKNSDGHNRVSMYETAGLGVKRPHGNTHKKNRILAENYLSLLILVAQKYDPDIVLMIALQAYAGLREGEVVNISCGRYKEIIGPMNTIVGIEIDINDRAEFFKYWEGNTNPGDIKKLRTQKIYDDFIMDVHRFYLEHIARYESKGFSTSKYEPLFRNSYGKPMTVQTYQERVKRLFYDYFVPALKRICLDNGTMPENTAYIEAYEQEYPGAHMFRHWFTMYLYIKAKLNLGEIQKWRGDSSPQSMLDYMHENADFIEEFKKASYAFPRKILEDMVNLQWQDNR